MTMSDCLSLLREHDNILIVSHKRPDGDTLCSGAALCAALRRLGKNSALLETPGTTEKFRRYVGSFLAPGMEGYDYFVAVDVASEQLLAESFNGRIDLCIDHHGSNSFYAGETYVQPECAACGEIIMSLIEEMHGGLTPEEAELLYIATATDCGCFCYANTCPQTLRDAAKLIEYGADNARLNKEFFRSQSLSRLTLEGMVFSTLRSYRGGKITVAIITLDMLAKAGATDEDCDDLASLPGKVEGSVVSITVRETAQGRSKASVRTNHLVNANDICARFGGGGHPMAGGCNAELDPFTMADRLVEITEEIWK